MNLLLLALLLLPSQTASGQDERPRREIASVFYRSQLLIISNEDEVAVVCFYQVDDSEHVKYAFRLLGKDGKETKGKGQLTAKYNTRNENGKTFMDPDHDFMTIKAGKIALLWLAGDKEKGAYYYIPEFETVQLGDPTYFEDIELNRFRKSSVRRK